MKLSKQLDFRLSAVRIKVGFTDAESHVEHDLFIDE